MEVPNYIPRLIDQTITEYLEIFGAVEIAGPMLCGKSTSAYKLSDSYTSFSRSEARDIASLQPSVALQGGHIHAIDEWQFVPAVWDEIRSFIDEQGREGIKPADQRRFILTGSSTLLEAKKIKHSGTGRIARVRMRSLSLQETGESSTYISLAKLFDTNAIEKSIAKDVPNTSTLDLEKLAQLCVRGGMPGYIDFNDRQASLALSQYISTIASTKNEELPEDPNTMLRFVESMARNVGSAPKIKTLIDDVFNEEKTYETLRNKTHSLLEFYQNRYVFETFGGWDAPIKSKQRLRTTPKYIFCDPGVLCAALNVNSKRLLENAQLFGQVFEQLVLRDLLVYTEAISFEQRAKLYYYRDDKGLEADAILELSDGRWAAIEIKLSMAKADVAQENLLKLRDKITSVPQAKNRAPEFLLVIVGVGSMAFTTREGVHVIPIDLLGA